MPPRRAGAGVAHAMHELKPGLNPNSQRPESPEERSRRIEASYNRQTNQSLKSNGMSRELTAPRGVSRLPTQEEHLKNSQLHSTGGFMPSPR